jgi:nitronate monooxygenase
MTILHTPVCDLLGIDVPIFQAGMARYTTPQLVAAVSNAGGLGIIGGLGRSPDELRSEIRQVRELTSRPFGVNHVIASSTPRRSRSHWPSGSPSSRWRGVDLKISPTRRTRPA